MTKINSIISKFMLLYVMMVINVYPQQYLVERTIDATFTGGSGLDVKDLNNDGKPDIIGASYGTTLAPPCGVKIWINTTPSPAGFTPQVIDPSYRSMTCFGKDINGDNFVDVIAGSWNLHSIVYWLNSGTNPIVWTRDTLATGFVNAHSVYAADMDNDGDNDILGGAAGLNEIALFINNGGNPIAWTKQVITSTFTGVRAVCAGDIDKDGDLDILGAAMTINEISWWRNDGGNPITWTKFVIDNNFNGAHWIMLCDMDNDTQLDILGAAWQDSDIIWWKNNSGNPLTWTKNTIDNYFRNALHATASDIDNDGDMDVFATSQPSNLHAYWINEGGSPPTWSRTNLPSPNTEPWPAIPLDVDMDGYSDIIVAGDLRLSWWENVSNIPNAPSSFLAFSDRTTPTTIKLQWNDPMIMMSGKLLTNFNIRIYRNGSFIAAVDSGIEEYTDINLIEHEQYSYYIRTATATDSSQIVSAGAFAGGCATAMPPTLLKARDSANGIFLGWKNPSKHTDGSPLDDMAYLIIFRDGSLFDSLEQTHLDTGQIRSYFDDTEGYHKYRLLVRDGDAPFHFSLPTDSVIGYGGYPLTEFSENFESGIGMLFASGTWDTTNTASLNGRLSFTDSPGGNYKQYINTYCLLPPIIISEEQIFIYHDIAIVQPPAYARIEISNDRRESFSIIKNYNWNDYVSWQDGIADNDDWLEETIDLTPYIGDTIIFRFKLQVGSAPPSDGWYIDSITIGRPDTVTPVISRTVNLGEGWNLISLPIDCEDKSTASLFPSSASAAFTFSNGYIPTDSIMTGTGYWLKYDSTDEITITGDLIENDTIDVRSGWNIIGSVSLPVPVTHIYSIPPNITTSNCMTYNSDSGYTVATIIEPGKGYWIRTEAGGKLVLPSNVSIQPGRRINIMETLEEPPSPPVENMNIIEHAPAEYMLYHNYPNPFNPNTVITYDLPATSKVTLRVYDILGQSVQTLVEKIQDAGQWKVEWQPEGVSSGIYFLHLEVIDVHSSTNIYKQSRPTLFLR